MSNFVEWSMNVKSDMNFQRLASCSQPCAREMVNVIILQIVSSPVDAMGAVEITINYVATLPRLNV